MALLITITNAGRAEIINAQNTGTEKVTIAAVAFGTAQYTPSKTQTALQAEVARITAIGGQAVAPDTIHVVAKDESNAAYNAGEFGLISDKGTLIAVYSQLPAAGWIIQKAAPSTLLLATDIILESLDASVIQFGDIAFINPPGTVDTPGVVQLEHSLTNPSNAKALTAGMGKKLQDEKEPAIGAGSTAQYWRGDKSWRDFATDVRAAVLTGLSTAASSAIVAADTVLAALGKLQAQITGLATSKLDATANAVSATKLQTARNINGVPFDGTANITVADSTKEPAVPAGTTAQYLRGDKNWRDFATDVRAAVLTGLSTAASSAIVAADTVLAALGKLQAQITGLAASKLDATANAVSATRLQTPRNINGVPFDGTANVTVADSTKEPIISAGTTSQYLRGDKNWRDFATDVRAAVLTGLSTATNSAILAADTVLAALGKLQAQINGLNTQVAAKAPLSSPEFTGAPTAPTAAAAANNTQLANTAWVKARLAAMGINTATLTDPGVWMCGDTGMMIQFGNVYITSSPTTYLFKTAFPTACLVCMTGPGENTTGVGAEIMNVEPGTRTRTGFSASATFVSTYPYIAIGY